MNVFQKKILKVAAIAVLVAFVLEVLVRFGSPESTNSEFVDGFWAAINQARAAAMFGVFTVLAYAWYKDYASRQHLK